MAAEDVGKQDNHRRGFGSRAGGDRLTTMTDELSTQPCQHCGSPVRTEEVPGLRRRGDTEVPVTRVRVCTNPDCETNGPNPRRGDAP